MREASLVKCGLPMPLVGMIDVTAPPAAGNQTKSAAAGPKNAAPASCISRAAARTATILSPVGDHARSLYRPVPEIAVVVHARPLFVARMIVPPFVSSHVVYAMDFPSGLQMGPNSPMSFLLTRCGVPLGRSVT